MTISLGDYVAANSESGYGTASMSNHDRESWDILPEPGDHQQWMGMPELKWLDLQGDVQLNGVWLWDGQGCPEPDRDHPVINHLVAWRQWHYETEEAFDLPAVSQEARRP